MDRVLKYYMFDFDDNILHMPIPIHMKYKGEPKDVLPGVFARIRKDPEWETCDNAFVEFRDDGPRGGHGFIDDIRIAIEQKSFGPCWNTFINAMIQGEIIMIITARGHEPNTLRNGVKYILNNYLSDEQKLLMNYNTMYLLGLFKDEKCEVCQLVDRYLDYCMFMGAYSHAFEERFGYQATTKHPEAAKEMIANYCLGIINEQNQKLGYKFTVGMSDDDKGNVKQIKKFFRKSNWSNVVDLYVYDTSNPEKIIKTKI